jgi:hypothetical protein
MFNHLVSTLLALAAQLGAADSTNPSTVHMRVDSARHEVVISVSPVLIPAMTPYSHHAKAEYFSIVWPVSGWMRGYRVDLVDSSGRLLPREMLHHAGMANLGRRQLAYPIAERLFAAAQETKPFLMPASMGIPVSQNDAMVLYYALVNPGQSEISGAVMRVTIQWTSARTRGVKDVLPLYANAKERTDESISFDVAPGASSTSAEFTIPVSGWVRMLGGHLHDYGVELRLEDAESNKVLARLRAKRDSDGQLRSVGQTKFLLRRRGLRLHADHRYRVVAVYDNPTCHIIKAGAMGFVVGAFIPDDVQSIRPVDTTDPPFQRDLGALLGTDAKAAEHHDVSSHSAATGSSHACHAPPHGR